MTRKTKRIQLCCLLAFSVIAALAVFGLEGASGANSDQDGFRKLFEAHARVASRAVKAYALPSLDPAKVYSLSVSLPALEELRASDRLSVTLRDGHRGIARKTLHTGDPDLYIL